MVNQLPASPIRVLVLDDSQEAGEVIAGLLRTEPGFGVSVSRVAYGEGIRAARRAEPDVMLLLADTLLASDPVVAVEELDAAVPGAAIVVLSAGGRHSTRDYILAGARDCVGPPYDRQTITTSVRQVHISESRRKERLAATISGGLRHHRCRVIAVHGAKGGVGATTVAVNLAIALRKLSHERVGLVDVSLQTGDVGVALNIVGNTGIDDLLPHLNQMDLDLLNGVMLTHESGVRVLQAPRDLERADAFGSDEMRRIISFLVGHFDYLVLDTAPTLDAANLAALDHADQIVLVTTPELPALKNAGRFLQLSTRLGYPNEKLALVVNRARSRQAVPLPEVERSLGVKALVAIPSAGSVFIRAANNGEPIVSNGFRGPARAIYQLAKAVAVYQPARRLPDLTGLLSGLKRRVARKKTTPLAIQPVVVTEDDPPVERENGAAHEVGVLPSSQSGANGTGSHEDVAQGEELREHSLEDEHPSYTHDRDEPEWDEQQQELERVPRRNVSG